MKRRLMIARAMMTRPRLLILDEPTAGVDIEIRRGMWDAAPRDQRRRHHGDPDHALPRGSREPVPQPGDHRPRRIVEHGPMKRAAGQARRRGLRARHRRRAAADAAAGRGRDWCRDDHTLEVEMPRAMDLNRVFAALGEAGIRVRSMRTKSNRLEELFMRMTGENAGDRCGDGARMSGTQQRPPAPQPDRAVPSCAARSCASCASGARPWCRRRSP
jgi:ABC-2 type transport system ATP-binding protein